jgi:ribonuclease P protein component
LKVEKKGEWSKGYGFAKSARILTSADYRRITAPGKKTVSPYFLLFVHAEAGAGEPRLGMTVSRKVGNAVVRNRIKRTIREFFRQNRNRLDTGLASVVIARPRAGRTGSAELTRSLAKLFLPYENAPLK